LTVRNALQSSARPTLPDYKRWCDFHQVGVHETKVQRKKMICF
jgi:hypothetical protein